MNDRHYADLSLEFNRHIVNLLDSLSALSELAQLSIHALDEADLLKRALEALMANQDMERCSIFLLDRDDILTNAAGLDWDEMLRGVSGAPTAAAPRPPTRYRLGDGIMGQSAATGLIVHCRSCADDARFKQYCTAPMPGALLCVPIVCETRVLGVLNVFHPRPEFFNAWHERLLLLFCQSLGRLLTNHRFTHHLNALVDEKTAVIAHQQGFLQSVLDSAPEPMMVIGCDYRIMMANRAARDMAPALTDNSRCHQISHHRDTPCDSAEHACPLQQVLAEKRIVKVIHRHFDASGDMRQIELLAAPLCDRDGTIIGIVESARDITERMNMAAALEKATQRLREAQRIAHIGSWERDFATDTVQCSGEIQNILGLPAETRTWLFADLIANIHPDDRVQVLQGYEEAVRQHRPYEVTYRLQTANGGIAYVHTQCETIYDNAGIPLATHGTAQDVTLGVLTEMSLRESEERFRTIADYTYDWEYWEGPRGEMLYCSPSCEELTGYGVSDFIMHPELLYEIIHPEDRPLMESHRADLQHADTSSINFRILRRDGAVRWIAHGCRSARDRDGRFMGRRASNRDITQLKEAEEQIRQLAYYDTLTGLPNRRLLLDRLGHALAQAGRFHRSMAVMFLDLDRFKRINDTLGHIAGDELLKQVAQRLTACVRAGDTVARPGGDEFIIVLTEISQPQDAAFVAEKILGAFATPIAIADQTIDITTSIGIVVYPVDGSDDIQELMKKADMAMYQAKEAGRNDYRFFDTGSSLPA